MKPSTLYFRYEGPKPKLDTALRKKNSQHLMLNQLESSIVKDLKKIGLTEKTFTGSSLIAGVENTFFQTTIEKFLKEAEEHEVSGFNIYNVSLFLKERGRRLNIKDAEFKNAKRGIAIFSWRKVLIAIPVTTLICIAGLTTLTSISYVNQSWPPPIELTEQHQFAKKQRRIRPIEEFRKSAHAAALPSTGGLTINAEPGFNIKEHTIEAWLSFSCGYCGDAWNFLNELKATELNENTKLVFHNIPKLNSETDITLALYFEGIKEQSPSAAMKFIKWVFAKQDQLRKNGTSAIDLTWLNYEKGFDMARFQRTIKSPDMERKLLTTLEKAKTSKITSTPTFVVDGKQVFKGAKITFNNLKSSIDQE